MYTPPSFRVDDVAVLIEFMQRNSFATLVSQTAGEMEATQIPLLLECDGHGTPWKLLGHVARANRQWERANGSAVLVLFQGAHAYISPTWYEVQNAVPTWNYVTVQVTGTMRIVSDQQQVLDTLRRTVDFYEQGQSSPWNIDIPDPGFIDQLAASIVAFEIEIIRVEGKAKLSQNHDLQRRQRVIDSLRKSKQYYDQAIAELMQQTLPGAT